MIDFLQHWLGLDNPVGPIYLFWSGIAGNLTLFTGIIIWYWHHNCHAFRCYRIGLHKVDGTPYTVCRKHHPEMGAKVTLKHIHNLHNNHKGV